MHSRFSPSINNNNDRAVSRGGFACGRLSFMRLSYSGKMEGQKNSFGGDGEFTHANTRLGLNLCIQ